MKSKILKRRLNPFLMAATILILSLLAGLSVLYQGQLSDVLSEKKNLRDKLETKNQEIKQLKQEKANLSALLTSKEQDIKSFTSEIRSLKSEKSRLKQNVSRLSSENSELKQKLSKANSSNKDLEVKLDTLNSTLGEICSFENNTVRDGEEKCEAWGHDFEGSEP